MEEPRLRLPDPPSAPTPHGFPLLAMIAPVLGAIVMWMVLDSVFALAFAALGPIIALASMGDARHSARRHRRQEQARFANELERLDDAIDRGLGAERTTRRIAHPGPRELAGRPPNDPARWQRAYGTPIEVVLGSGTQPSGLRILPLERILDPEVEAECERRRARAALLPGAPVVVDARGGIGIVAGAVTGAALLRSIVTQLIDALPPDRTHLIASSPERSAWDWLEAVPCRIEFESAGLAQVRVLTDEDALTIAVAPRASGLPRDCRNVVELEAHRARWGPHEFVPELLSAPEARAAVALVRAAAELDGLSLAASLPDVVAWRHVPVAEPGTLAAQFLVAQEPLSIDLAVDGPHAIVGGTTGSGKSELLIAWVASLAAAHAPERLAILLVDFKGGASFGHLAELPHCVGTVTDLDAHGALRALTSLRAELHRRERILQERGARSIDEAGDALPRLVIVVDEFQAMLTEYPDLHRLFVDIAARGRSLGVHLILCTQRPAEAARDSLLANCGLRLCLRVTSTAESIAVVGAPDAGDLLLTQRGRVVVQVSGQSLRHAQAALVDDADVVALIDTWRGAPSPRRPWVDPPGQRISVADVRQLVLASSNGTDDGVSERGLLGVPFALVDRPAVQRVDPLTYLPEREGNLLVLGGAASGKSTMLDVLAAEVPVVRGLEALGDAVDDPTERSLLLIDDLDALLARAGEDHALALVDAIARRMREARSTGSAVCFTARRLSHGLSTLASLVDRRVLLRMPSRHEHVLAGGASDQHLDDAPAGAGWWGEERMQIALPERAPRLRTGRRIPWTVPQSGIAVVTRDPGFAERCAASTALPVQSVAESTDRPALIVGSASDWEARWGWIDTLRTRMPVVFAEPNARDVRQLLRGAALPPVIDGSGVGWWFEGFEVHRVELPA